MSLKKVTYTVKSYIHFEKSISGRHMNENEISNIIIGCAIEVHKTLGGPGLLESIYEAALCQELILNKIAVRRQVAVPVKYKGFLIKEPIFIDILVCDKIIIEVKATEKDNPIFSTQLLTYLRMTGLKLGLLINFGKTFVKDGIIRIVNGLDQYI